MRLPGSSLQQLNSRRMRIIVVAGGDRLVGVFKLADRDPTVFRVQRRQA